MKQYNTIKAKYPDAMLLFRVGDFYETFGADAINGSMRDEFFIDGSEITQQQVTDRFDWLTARGALS